MKKIFTLFFTFFTSICLINAQCDHTFRMLDSYGDGWNGFGSPLTCAVDIIVDGTPAATGVGLNFVAGGSADEIFTASTGSTITLANWGVGAYDSEVSWEIIDGDGNVVATGAHGDTPSVTGACPPPPVCDHTFRMLDSYGDGWNGFGSPLTCAVDIIVDGTPVATGVGLNFVAGGSADEVFSASTGSSITLANWGVGAYDSEVSWELLDGGGAVIASGAHGDITGGAGNCPSCSQPSGLTASNVTSSDAILNWTAGGTETQWNIEYGAAGYTQGTGTTASAVTSNPYTLTGLSAGVSYDIYIQADCGSATSTWAGPVSIITIGDCSSAGSYVYGDNETSANATGFIANNPGDYITIDFSNGSTETGYDYWFINDAVDGSGNTIATGDGDIIGSYESTTGEISFYVESDASYSPGGNGLAGDTIIYTLSCSAPPACVTPTSLTATNITGSSADLSWTAGGTEPEWNVEYGLSGFAQGTGTSSLVQSSTTIAAQTPGLFTTGPNATWTNVYTACVLGDGNNGAQQTLEINITSLPAGGANARKVKTVANGNWNNGPAIALTLGINTLDVAGVAFDRAVKFQFSSDAVEFSSMTLNGNPVYTGGPNLSLSGLSSNTTYDYYVQAQCGVGDTSSWVGPFSFTTPCGVLVAPYCQNFDLLSPNNGSIFSCITTDNMGDCWANDPSNTNNWTARSTPTGSGNTGPSADHTTGGGNYVFLESSSCPSDTSNLWSAEMDVSGLTNPEVRFWYHMYGATMGSLTVYASTDGGTTWSTSLWNQAGDQQNQWKEAVIDMSSYTGATSLIVRFEGITGTSFTSDMAIDDFCVQEAPACPSPLAFAVDSVTATSVYTSWGAGGTETAWNVQWDTAGFALGTGTITGTTTTNFIGSGLNPSTNYGIYVQADCGGDSSVWVGPLTFTTMASPPDTAQGVSCVSGGNSSVVFSEDFDNNNAGWTGDINGGNATWEIPDGATSTNTGANVAYSGANYMNYEASGTTTNQGSIVSPAIDLSAAQDDAELSFWMHAYGASMGTLDVGVSTTATGPFTSVFTWSGQYQTSGNDPWVNVGVDLSSYVGQTIYIQLTQIDDVNNLGSGFDGDMSIDLFEVTTCVSCSQPTNLMASNITTTTADLSWSAGGSETSWNVVVDTAGFNPYASTAIVSTDSLYLTGLVSGGCYDFYVQADCGNDTSAWAGPYSFCTLPPPVCYYIINMQDSYGDGWNGASIDVSANGILLSNVSLAAGSTGSDTVYAFTGDQVSFYFNSGSWDTEITYDIIDPLGATIFSGGPYPANNGNDGLAFVDSSSNSICAPPSDDLGAIGASTDIASGCEINSAVVSIDIYNYGVAAQAGFDVTYSVSGANQITETVSDTIQPGDTLTYTFTQVLDVTVDGLYCLDVSTLLANDLDLSNDELIGAYCIENYVTPDAPTGTSDTICEGSGDTLMLMATSNGNITWYDAATGGNVVGTGNTLSTSVNTTTTYYAEAEANIADTLSTTYAGGNGCGSGNMFDIIPNTDMTIDSMRAHFNAADSVKVYYKSGTYAGFEEDPSAWTLLGSAAINSDPAIFEALVFSVGQLSVSAGDTVGIYVEASVRYTNVAAGTTYSNADMTIAGGTGLCASFGTTFSPRMWNGTIFYSTGGCVGPRTAVDAIVLDCTNILEIGMLDFSLFPNPNNGEFTIVNDGASEIVSLSITDVQGKEVISKTLNFNKGEQKLITLENIERGVYLVRLNSDSGSKIINMIVH
ncbi:MAG: hypothetical protein CMD01_03795 [Flavobacteriales bacterium]|nr:hypothetical protein [Flavobacteriales bacterium]